MYSICVHMYTLYVLVQYLEYWSTHPHKTNPCTIFFFTNTDINRCCAVYITAWSKFTVLSTLRQADQQSTLLSVFQNLKNWLMWDCIMHCVSLTIAFKWQANRYVYNVTLAISKVLTYNVIFLTTLSKLINAVHFISSLITGRVWTFCLQEGRRPSFFKNLFDFPP